MEECRLTGLLHKAINSTFIALIPKVDSPNAFDEFRPISLCSCLYKIIAKIISNHLKPILSNHILHEQFAFLHNRKIHEVVGTAQEALHSIKLKKLKGTLLNIELSKAFNRVSWLDIRILLTHLGFPVSFVTWTMCCITSTSFNVLINGCASYFFHEKHGLSQGCPLPSLLFLLVMEAISVDSYTRPEGRGELWG